VIHPELLAQQFALTHRVIHMQTAGLSHDDSLLQLPFRGNCLNWVLGHIVATRDRALTLLNEQPVWGESEGALYQTGSAPITSGERALSLEKIMSDLDCSQERLMSGLRRASAQHMSVAMGDETVGELLAGLHFHESYHTGQTELLRQLAGKNDAIV
jgi:hypothetical protein